MKKILLAAVATLLSVVCCIPVFASEPFPTTDTPLNWDEAFRDRIENPDFSFTSFTESGPDVYINNYTFLEYNGEYAILTLEIGNRGDEAQYSTYISLTSDYGWDTDTRLIDCIEPGQMIDVEFTVYPPFEYGFLIDVVVDRADGGCDEMMFSEYELDNYDYGHYDEEGHVIDDEEPVRKL